MSEFVLHPDAIKDLEEIWEYVAGDNLSAADQLIEEIYDAIQSLVPFPYVGHRRADLTSRPLRFQTVQDYVIAYAPDEKRLTVIAILHGRRNPRVIAAILRSRAEANASRTGPASRLGLQSHSWPL